MSTVLVIHAHQGDETFANAGRIAQFARDGHRVVGVIATGGEAGELTGAADLVTAPAHRLSKYQRAFAILGAASWEWFQRGAEWCRLIGRSAGFSR